MTARDLAFGAAVGAFAFGAYWAGWYMGRIHERINVMLERFRGLK